MKRSSAGVYVYSAMAGVAVLGVLLAIAYFGGYVLLADRQGLYPSQSLFQFYEPAARLQRWATNKGVSSGYVDAQGRRFARRLPAADEWPAGPFPPASPPPPGTPVQAPLVLTAP